MQVLLVNGSPRKDGNTGTALSLLDNFFQEKGIETKWFQIKNQPLRGCVGCNGCNDKNRCVFSDDQCNELIEDILRADGVIIGSPVYFAAPNGALCSLLDRVFYATCTRSQLFKGKPAALVTCAWLAGRRHLTGCTATLFPARCRLFQATIIQYFKGIV